MASLRNIDRTDREMLLIIESVANKDGLATSEDVADALDIRAKNGRSPAGRVSSRLSWMARLGQLERLDPRQVGRRATEAVWIITPLGEALLRGRLTKSIESAIDRSNVGQHVLMMRVLARRAYVEAGSNEAAALRREYLHNVAQRGR